MPEKKKEEKKSENKKEEIIENLEKEIEISQEQEFDNPEQFLVESLSSIKSSPVLESLTETTQNQQILSGFTEKNDKKEELLDLYQKERSYNIEEEGIQVRKFLQTEQIKSPSLLLESKKPLRIQPENIEDSISHQEYSINYYPREIEPVIKIEDHFKKDKIKKYQITRQ